MSEKSEKCLKKRNHDSKYKSEWASEIAGVVKGSEETRAKCTFCITEFSIVHGGKHDINFKRHCNSTSHLTAVEEVNASSCCYGITLDRGLADGVRKAVSKANADLAVARAEEHMVKMKTLEERI